MKRKEEIGIELNRAREAGHAGNEGRARVSARRAAGIALEELADHIPQYQSTGPIVDRLMSLKQKVEVPDLVREAAGRLAARLDRNFVSPSKDPIDDAMIIITFVEQMLESH